VRVLPCVQIADEIEHSLEILETTALNMPARPPHDGAPPFTPTWERLSEVERDVFMKLIRLSRRLHVGRRLPALSGASVVVLSSLADKSLLRLDTNDRYDLHELLRQYGRRTDHGIRQRQTFARDAHSAYYTDFLCTASKGI